VSELANAEVGDLVHTEGKTFLRLRVKGGDEKRAPLSPEVAQRVRVFLSARGASRDAALLGNPRGERWTSTGLSHSRGPRCCLDHLAHDRAALFGRGARPGNVTTSQRHAQVGAGSMGARCGSRTSIRAIRMPPPAHCGGCHIGGAARRDPRCRLRALLLASAHRAHLSAALFRRDVPPSRSAAPLTALRGQVAHVVGEPLRLWYVSPDWH
jgi:hypothetical protein